MPPTRRRSPRVLLLVLLSLLAAACGGDAPGPGGGGGEIPTNPASIEDLKKSGTTFSLLQAQSSLVAGRNLFTFGLVTAGGDLVQGGAPEVWFARDERSRPMGPFRASFHRFTAYDRFEDESPRSPLNSFYAAEVDLPSAGTWAVAAVARGNAGGVGSGFIEVVKEDDAVAAVGSKAISVASPVARSTKEAREICTREPEPDPMHAISLDDALRSGRPTVVTFATPLLCESEMCGPVVDEVWAAMEGVGEDRANFIHVEVFLPGPDLRPPPATHENAAPAFKAWDFPSEPWTLVIDDGGIIRARFEGPVVASQIEAALAPLL